MEPDWWARGIALGALLIALIDFGWRFWDARSLGRSSLGVTGSAGGLIQGAAGPMLARGRRLGESLVVIDVSNRGRRPAVVQQVGFKNDSEGRQLVLNSIYAGQLPKRLEPGDAVTIPADSRSFLEQMGATTDWTPYCKDAEGRTHTGNVDDHFRRLSKHIK